MIKFGIKNALFWYFWTGIWKQYCRIWNQPPRICLTAKFREKMKMPEFGTKTNAIFGYFFVWNFKKLFLYLKSAPAILSACKILRKKQKCLKLREKMPCWGIFGLEFQNNCCHIWNQHPQICLIEKFLEKINISKFGTKNGLFGNFWAKIFKSFCHIWN